MEWVGDWQLCDLSTGVVRLAFVLTVAAAEFACFKN